ncbi:hypothetical protein G3T14_06730 [Methylobacterium sp. BTF04]|uniref:hypothetical protein n=1 Tax=Methylobacterium sp. BTF04 TaxID=2708300 RepID=UPI0013D5614F|nr:hypothetical protein [Methylobacterium sp. BTF04]NEU11824.1 hypothetical protein [Methylobacterium sp. BTF04]
MLQAQAIHAERIGVALIVAIGILLLVFAVLATPATLIEAAPFDDAATWMGAPSLLPAPPANHG